MKKIFKILSLGLILPSLIIISCEKDGDIKTEINEQKITQNLKQLSEDFLDKTIEIDNEFAKNQTINIDASYKNSLLLSKTENDIKIVLKKAGILNGETILKLVKQRINLQNNFRIKNPDFYLLDENKRADLLNNQYDLILENYIANQNSKAKTTSCSGQYNTDIGRCNRTYGKCALVAVIAAADGLFPGLVVGVFCAWDLSDCKSDAREDYESCMN
jgi:hypothetical protein